MPGSSVTVSNSGPLIALAGVGRLDVFQQVYGSLVVPPAVCREVAEMGGERAGARFLAEAPWIERVELAQLPDPFLVVELGAGEAEAIALASQRPGSLVLLDERRARRIAEMVYGLRVRGIVGTLVSAKTLGVVAEVRPLLEAMQRNGYYLANELVERVCREVGE